MVEKKVAVGPTHDDAVSYLNSVKEAFHSDPAKYKEFLKLLDDKKARRLDQASFFARVGDLIKDHPKLLSGLRIFFPDQAKIFIPHEPELPDNIEIQCDDADALLNKNKEVNLNNVAAEPTLDDAVSYMSTVKEAFTGEPAKYKDFLKLLDDLVARRVDEASFNERVGKLFKGHPNLLPGLNAFLPAETKIFIPHEPQLPDNIEIKRDDADALLNKNKVNLNNVAVEPTVDDISSYATTVLEAFHGEPAKCKDFLNLCCDLDGKRVDQASFVARAEQLFTDHPNLLAGASVFFPDQANILSLDDAVSYMSTVKEAFNGEPAKFEDFLKLLDDLVAQRVDEASLNARGGQIFKDHPNLLPGFNAYLPAGAKIIIPPETAKIIIPPEPEQPTELPDNLEIKHKNADHLLNMIKTRFQRIDAHVPYSFVQIMEDFKQGKKSEEEVREEVIDLIYYHEDLREEFLRLLQ